MFPRNLWDFHAEIVRIFSKLYLEDLVKNDVVADLNSKARDRVHTDSGTNCAIWFGLRDVH